jgi:hypothetical protein
MRQDGGREAASDRSRILPFQGLLITEKPLFSNENSGFSVWGGA